MKKFVYCLVVVILIVCLGACRSKKKAVVTEQEQEIPDGQLLSCYSIESFSATSCRLEVSGGGIQSVTLNGSIFVIPDSVFFFRGRLLIEMVRGAIYRDSFVVVNYLERTVYKGKNTYLQNLVGFPVNPKTMLMLITDDNCDNIFYALNNQHHPVRISYDAYNQFDDFELPTIVNVSAGVSQNSFRVRAELRQIELNTSEQFQMNIPSNYRVVVLE